MKRKHPLSKHACIEILNIHEGANLVNLICLKVCIVEDVADTTKSLNRFQVCFT